MVSNSRLNVTVQYPPAAEPFHDHDADPQETVGHLKTRVLTAFTLTEGQTGNGDTVTFTLYDQKTPLENTGATLASLAGQAHALHLKLAQQITQGSRS